MKTSLILILLSLLSATPGFSRKFTISGYIQDATSGERLLYANIFEPRRQMGTTSNNYGFYSLTLPETTGDSLTIVVSYIGYQRWQRKMALTQDVWLTVELQPAVLTGQAVEVVADAIERIEDSPQMSQIHIPIRQMAAIPALLGESDIMKVLQLLPGVQSGGEGSSGIYVRGGAPDQNLILIDGAPVYNASHLFGFFSVFNSDAIQNVNLIKGGFPAHYGGRLSSVVDISMKEGNNQRLAGAATIGLVASRFLLEGPLQTGKSSFILSGRRTYIDLIARPFMHGEVGGYYFYDLNAKLNYIFSQNDRIFWSAYTGDDRFYARDDYEDDTYFNKNEFDLGWGNFTTTARWNHIFTQKLFSNTTLTYSKFRFNTGIKDITKENNQRTEQTRAEYDSGIKDYSARLDFDYLPNPNHDVKFGANIIWHEFNPGASHFKIEGTDLSELDTLIAPVEKHLAVEASTYVEDEWKLSPRLNLNFGIHASLFSVSDTRYHSIEPRFALRYLLGNWALKASYVNMTQYIHLLSNSGIGLPTDLWLPSTKIVQPQQARQVALGLARSFRNGQIEFSAEGYYKSLQNIIEYKEGSDFLGLETDWQQKIEIGQGRSYGVEFFLQKKQGRTTGWLGYTLAWADRQFDNLNFGRRFPFRYDRRHDIALVLTRMIKPGIELSGTWVYGTGNAISMGVARYSGVNGLLYSDFGDFWSEIIYYKERNGFRMGAYHRLDLGIRFIKRRENRERIWTLGLYNAYSRKNPFFYYFDTEDGERRVLKQVSLFPIIPAISYSRSF